MIVISLKSVCAFILFFYGSLWLFPLPALLLHIAEPRDRGWATKMFVGIHVVALLAAWYLYQPTGVRLEW
jgi:hypothetical protein